jgi:membrane glycosyltransferase
MLAGAACEMYRVLDVGGLTIVEAIVLFCFSVKFAWIALAFMGALAGFAVLLRRRSRPQPASSAPIRGRTAMLMPTYNENPERVFAAAEAMAEGTARAGGAAAIDWFILSDTTDPSVQLAEETALVAIRTRLGPAPLDYSRHRRLNTGRKAGNIADFCRRWGGAYDYLIVLDADSLMEPATIIELIRRMEADPDAGLIQTVPALVNGRTVLPACSSSPATSTDRCSPPACTSGSSATASTGGTTPSSASSRSWITAGCRGSPGRRRSAARSSATTSSRRRSSAGTAGRSGSPTTSAAATRRCRRRCSRRCSATAAGARATSNISGVSAAGFAWIAGTISDRHHVYLASPLWLLLLLAGLGSLQAQFVIGIFRRRFQLFRPGRRSTPSARCGCSASPSSFSAPKLMGSPSSRRSARMKAVGGTLRLVASFLFEVVASAQSRRL